MRFLFVLIALCVLAAPAFAQKDQEESGNFFSCAISDMFNKVGQYTSGEKEIVMSEDKWKDEEEIEYGVDPTGRKIPKATTRSGKALSQ